MGTLFIVGVIFAILLVLTLFLYVLNAIVNISVTEKVANRMYRMVCWNPILRFLIESYIFIAISCCINLTEFTFGDSGSRASSISTVVGMILIILLPFFVLYVMHTKFAKLKNKQVWKRIVKQSFNKLMNHINGCLSCRIFIRALRRLNKVSRQLRHLQYRLPKVFWGSA